LRNGAAIVATLVTPLRDDTPSKRTRLLFLGVLLAAIVLLGFRLGVEPVGRSSEKRCHEVAKEMVSSRDYLVPRYDDEPRLQKPPLYYWLAAATAKAVGDVSLLSTRLPSAIAALLLLLATMAFVTRLLGSTTGLLAGCLFVVTFQFGTSGRRGDAEMWLALASTLSSFGFARYAASRSTSDLVWFGASLALAFLAKATVAIFTVLAPILVFGFFERSRLRGLGKPLAGIVAAAAIIGFSWYVVIILRVDGAFRLLASDAALPLGVKVAGGDDATHYESPLFYFSKFFSVAFPTGLLVPLVVLRAIRTRAYATSPPLRIMLVGAITQFVLFSLLPQKQRHYLLPLAPHYAILLADALRSDVFTSRVREGCRWLAILAGVVLAAAAAVQAFGAVTFTPESVRSTIALLVSGGVAGVALAITAGRRLPTALMASLTVGVVCLLGDYHGRFKPWQDALDEAAEDGLTFPDEARLREGLSNHSWLGRMYKIDELLERAEEERIEAGY
jgi:4-amino-4-deoxy-L-arabinose transferase-like glycosyltransferase